MGERHPIDLHRAGNVLEALLAHVLEFEIEAAGGVLLHPVRYADTAGRGQGLKTGSDVDAVAEDVAVLDNDVALVDADAELDAAGGRNARGPLGHALLHLGSAAQRV